MMATNQPRILVLVRDLMLRSRIDAAAEAMGHECAYASTLEQARSRCEELKPAIVFADLSDANFPAEAVARELGTLEGLRLIGFASHMDLKSLVAGRKAGFEKTLSRSELVAQLPQLLKL